MHGQHLPLRFGNLLASQQAYLSGYESGATFFMIVFRADDAISESIKYSQAGYPIGSGTVESACKVVVQQRMKQAGMRWSRSGAQTMLALRCALLSDRWHDTWRRLPRSS